MQYDLVEGWPRRIVNYAENEYAAAPFGQAGRCRGGRFVTVKATTRPPAGKSLITQDAACAKGSSHDRSRVLGGA
jgi:hypothetical protein